MCVSRAWKFRRYSSIWLGQGAPAANRWRTSDAYGFVPARLWTGICLRGLLGLLALVASGVGWLLAMHLGFSKHGQGMSFRSSRQNAHLLSPPLVANNALALWGPFLWSFDPAHWAVKLLSARNSTSVNRESRKCLRVHSRYCFPWVIVKRIESGILSSSMGTTISE